MRAGAQEAGSSGFRTRREWPGWLVAAFVCLVVAVAYLCLSIAEAVRSDGDDVAVLLSPSAQLTTESAATQGEPPGVDAPPAAATVAPIRGLAAAVSDAKLANLLNDLVGDDGDHIAVSVKRVSDGRAASVNGDFQFYAASTFKLAVLYEAELRHFRGEITYEDKILISDEDAAEDLGTSGFLEFEDDGSITIENLLRAMIEVSDNSSAVALMHEFGSGNIDRTLRELGIETMTLNQVELWTTADDLARLMEAIYVGEGLGPTERAHMRELLLAQTIRNGIPAALDSEVADGLMIGNKTGTWPGAQHDVAFVEAQTGAYVVALLTDGSYEGWEALHRLMQGIHKEMIETP